MKKASKYKRIAKGVQLTPSGTYRMRKMVNGVRVDVHFTNKTKAIKAYKSL